VFSGAFGLALGFGLQKTFGNLLAGIILLMDRSIKPGDVIAVSDMTGRESFGQIRKIGIRAISVITRDKKEYLIPNENLMINQVENWSYSARDVRVKAPLSVGYETDLERAEELMLLATQDTPRVLEFPEPKVLLMGFGESGIAFEIRFWILDPEEGISSVRSDVYKRVWKLFQQEGIHIPFPQRDLNFGNPQQFEQLVAAIEGKTHGPSKAG
jgi:small-conductance mechanosensitive channel